MMRTDVLAELRDELASQVPAVAAYLLPEGKRDRHHNWRVGSVFGEEGQSLALCLKGKQAGLWLDRATDERGNLIKLWMLSRQVDFPTAIEEIRVWLGDARKVSRRRDNLESNRRRLELSPQTIDNSWKPIWGETVENGAHKAYLAGRLGRLPGDLVALRYHPRCPRGRDRLPAMVALMCDAITNEPTGIHRTFIKPDGSGKADVTPNKMMMGRAGSSVVKLTPDEDVTTGLGICEGIEDGIAILNAGWAPVWCCMSAGNIASFPLLHGIESLTVFADADAPGRKAAAAVVQRWHQAGREAAIAEPPDGIKDFGEMGNA